MSTSSTNRSFRLLVMSISGESSKEKYMWISFWLLVTLHTSLSSLPHSLLTSHLFFLAGMVTRTFGGQLELKFRCRLTFDDFHLSLQSGSNAVSRCCCCQSRHKWLLKQPDCSCEWGIVDSNWFISLHLPVKTSNTKRFKIKRVRDNPFNPVVIVKVHIIYITGFSVSYRVDLHIFKTSVLNPSC